MIIKLSKFFYSKNAVKTAVYAYKEWACFSVSETKTDYHIKLKNIHKEVSADIANEFCNFVFLASKIRK